MNNTKTLCNMAWDYPMFFMFTNHFGYCCRTPKIDIDNAVLEEMGEDFFSNHPHFVKRRQDLANGIQSSDCKTCWQLEDKGFKSSRTDKGFKNFMMKNKTPMNNLSYDQVHTIPNIEQSNYTNVIEIVLNNTCDAKCTYCSEFYSTQWVSEKKKHNDLHPNYVPQEHRNPRAEELFWSWYNNKTIKTVRRFGFIGGEPFIIDALYECFDKLIEIHENTNVREDKIELCITSNMNTPPAYFQKFLSYVPKLSKYFNIIIQVSGENIGADLEYVRHGVKWERWKNNVEYLLANTEVKLSFLPCLNLLSIPRFFEYLRYFEMLCKKYGYMDIYHNIVTWPTEQSPMTAPKEFAKYFDKCIELTERLNLAKDLYSYKHFLEWLIQTRDAILNNPAESDVNPNALNFYLFFAKLDERRRTSLLNIFPEFETYYNVGKSLAKPEPKVISIHVHE